MLKSASKSNVSKYPISHSGVIERIYTKVDVTGTVVRKIARFVLDSTSLLWKAGIPGFLASADWVRIEQRKEQREALSPLSQFENSAQVSHTPRENKDQKCQQIVK